MTSFEREVIDRLGRIETKLNTDFTTLHGNGQPGLVQKHALIESRVSAIELNCKSRAELSEKIERVRERGLTKVLKFLAWGVTAATAAYAAWKSNKGL